MSDAFIRVQLEPGELSHHDCLWRVRGALANIDGVNEIMVEEDCRNAIISICPNKVNSNMLIQALRTAGFGTRSATTQQSQQRAVPLN